MKPSAFWAAAIVLATFADLTPSAALADGIEISGSVFYRERMAIPDDSTLTVELVDTTQAAPQPVGSVSVRPTGQVPIAFSLEVADEKIASGIAFGLKARIEVDGETWFAGDASLPADMTKLVEPVSVMVRRVAERSGSDASASGTVKGVTWRLTGLGDKDVAPDVTTTLIFDEDGSIHGSGGCNRFGGHAKFEGASLKIKDVFSTMMACEEAASRQEGEFLAALSKAASHTVHDGSLTLLDASGTAVARLVAAP